MTSTNLPNQMTCRKVVDGHVAATYTVPLRDIAWPDPCPGISAVMKAFNHSPVAKLAKAIENSPLSKAIKAVDAATAPLREAMATFRRIARIARGERRTQRIHIRAGLSRAPRRRTASSSIRRATADSGGDDDGEPPRSGAGVGRLIEARRAVPRLCDPYQFETRRARARALGYPSVMQIQIDVELDLRGKGAPPRPRARGPPARGVRTAPRARSYGDT